MKKEGAIHNFNLNIADRLQHFSYLDLGYGKNPMFMS